MMITDCFKKSKKNWRSWRTWIIPVGIVFFILNPMTFITIFLSFLAGCFVGYSLNFKPNTLRRLL